MIPDKFEVDIKVDPEIIGYAALGLVVFAIVFAPLLAFAFKKIYK